MAQVFGGIPTFLLIKLVQNCTFPSFGLKNTGPSELLLNFLKEEFALWKEFANLIGIFYQIQIISNI